MSDLISRDIQSAYDELQRLASGSSLFHYIRYSDFIERFSGEVKDSGVKSYTYDEIEDLVFTSGKGIIYKIKEQDERLFRSFHVYRHKQYTL